LTRLLTEGPRTLKGRRKGFITPKLPVLLINNRTKSFQVPYMVQISENFIKMQWGLKWYLENRYSRKNSCCQSRNT
jgi:hypothetical protein